MWTKVCGWKQTAKWFQKWDEKWAEGLGNLGHAHKTSHWRHFLAARHQQLSRNALLRRIIQCIIHIILSGKQNGTSKPAALEKYLGIERAATYVQVLLNKQFHDQFWNYESCFFSFCFTLLFCVLCFVEGLNCVQNLRNHVVDAGYVWNCRGRARRRREKSPGKYLA